MAAPKTFVLVHGSWRGGWCWRRVADLLTRDGHRVFAPTLTALADRSHLLSAGITLDTHITDIVNLLEWEDLSDVVLCGHSYGGIVISGVAERVAPGTIASIVFLDAFMPDDGQSLEDLFGPIASNPMFKQGLEASGGVALPPIPAAAFGLNERDTAWVDAKCTPHPYRTAVDKIKLSGARDRVGKKSFIRATRREIPLHKATFERVRSDPTWRLYEIACGHDVMLDEPVRLSEILAEVA
jgi:pimeloyl-ACP methyl ester carboxylesterase